MNNDNIDDINQTYIYKVFEKLDIPFEDSLVSTKTMSTDYQTKDYYITLLDINHFVSISLGSSLSLKNSRRRILSSLNYEKNNLKEYTYKLKEIVNKYLDILIPVHKLATKKFSDLNYRMLFTPYGPNRIGDRTRKYGLYSILSTPRTDGTSLKFFTHGIKRLKENLSEYPNDYLKFLVDLSKRFEATGVTLSYRGTDYYFADFEKNVNKIIEKRAMFEDIDDLGNNESEIGQDSKSDQSQEAGEDLNIDDLELPE